MNNLWLKVLSLFLALTVWFIVSKLHPLIGRFADTHDTPIGKLAPILLAAAAVPLLAALFALTWPEKREPVRTPALP